MYNFIASAAKDLANSTLPDGGPMYFETNLQRVFVEPWNASSALLFIVISVFWLIRLKGKYRNYFLIVSAMVVLFFGGIGGALYHAFRHSGIFLYMDVIPIFVLMIAATIFLWNRIVPHWSYLLLIFPVFAGADRLIIPNLDISIQMATNLSYANLAVMIIIPLIAVLFKTSFRYVRFIVIAIAFFFGALYFREADSHLPAVMHMGTHWLWHICGAMACFFFVEYMYRLISLKNAALRLLKLNI